MQKTIVMAVIVLVLALATAASAQRDTPGRGQARGDATNAPGRAAGMATCPANAGAPCPMLDRQQDARWPIDRDRRWQPRCVAGHIVFLTICVVMHILLTVWVFQDMRQRNAGSGLWIAIVLLSGFFGAILYAVVRLGDIRQQAKSSPASDSNSPTTGD